MKFPKWTLGVALVVGLAPAIVAQEKGGNDETGPYEVVPNWPQPLHQDYTWGRTAAIWAESPDRVFVFQSGELPALKRPIAAGGVPIRAAASENNGPGGCECPVSKSEAGRPGRWEHLLMIFNRDGKLVDSWEQHNKRFVRPHSVKISPYDPERHVWLVEDGAHMIYKFTNDGKQLVMSVGEFRVPGNDRTHFNRPTDIAFLPNGDFFVSDGYVNTRVVKFDKDGKYLMEWGRPGKSAPAEFNTVHGVAVDNRQRVYVSDRGNSRIQVFDQNGKHVDTWPNIRFPLSVGMSKDQHLWVNDGLAQKFLKFDLNGRLLYSWGTFGGEPGQLWGTHAFSIDSEGNLYTAEVWGGRPQKFRPKRGADPSKLIGALFNTTTN